MAYNELFLKLVSLTKLSDHNEFISKTEYRRPIISGDNFKFHLVKLWDDEDVEIMFDYVIAIEAESTLFYADVIIDVNRDNNNDGIGPSTTANLEASV